MSAKGIPVAEFQRVQDELIALKEELYTFKERDKRLTQVDRDGPPNSGSAVRLLLF